MFINPQHLSLLASYYYSYSSQNPLNSDSPSTLLIEILSAKVGVSCRFYSCLFNVEQSLMHFFKLIICLQFFCLRPGLKTYILGKKELSLQALRNQMVCIDYIIKSYYLQSKKCCVSSPYA